MTRSDDRAFQFTVRQLTRYLKTLLSRDRTLQDVSVRGEIGDLTVHASGHIYFTLKDEHSQLRCVMFREEASLLSFEPASGTEVVARGAVTIYEPRGQYQLVVREMERSGIGELHAAYERLRRKLAAEGLFDEARKRPLPAFPQKIALLTSPVGAALHDMLTTLRARWPSAEIVVIPTPVSGAAAGPGIARSLALLSAVEGLDLAILARGGGSFEDLAGFNAEEVARALPATPVPVITGIGHETDFTIADFVADRRTPTPTAAAAAATPDRRDLLRTVRGARSRFAGALGRRRAALRRELSLLRARPVLRSPQLLLMDRRQRIDELAGALRQSLAAHLERLQTRFDRAFERLHSLSPQAVLARGYSIMRLCPEGRVVRSFRQLAVGDRAEVVLSEGSAGVEVSELHEPRGETLGAVK